MILYCWAFRETCIEGILKTLGRQEDGNHIRKRTGMDGWTARRGISKHAGHQSPAE
jgi:hypothetical protein